MTFGADPKKTSRRKSIGSLKTLAVTVAEHRHEDEAFSHHGLANQLAQATVTYLGAGPERLVAAVRSLSDPISAVPVSQILRGTPPLQTPG